MTTKFLENIWRGDLSQECNCLQKESFQSTELINMMDQEFSSSYLIRFQNQLLQFQSADHSSSILNNSWAQNNQNIQITYGDETKLIQNGSSIIDQNQTSKIEYKVYQQALVSKEQQEEEKDKKDQAPASVPKKKKISKASAKTICKKVSNTRKAKSNKKKQAYKTKNFLAQFKTGHFECFEKITGQKIYEAYPQLLIIKKKHGINRQDYLFIYSISELKEIWTQFFKNRQLYRILIDCGCSVEIKKNYLEVLYRFQEAFETGRFDRIN